eukprot:2232927-Rhodomonas_salina.1
MSPGPSPPAVAKGADGDVMRPIWRDLSDAVGEPDAYYAVQQPTSCAISAYALAMRCPVLR